MILVLPGRKVLESAAEPVSSQIGTSNVTSIYEHSEGVLTSFGRVGTVGMERGYSCIPFVPFHAVSVHTEFPGNRATDPNRK